MQAFLGIPDLDRPSPGSTAVVPLWVDALQRFVPRALTGLAISGFTVNQIPVGTSGGGLAGTPALTFNGTTLALTGAMTISTTLNVTGAAATGNLTVTGDLQMTGKWIANNAVGGYYNSTSPAIYGTTSGGTFPFDAFGNLVLEGRGGGTNRSVVLASAGGAFTAYLDAVGTFNIPSTTASTTTTTGALIVTGGVGIGGALYAGSIQNTPIGSTTKSSGQFTTLGATGTSVLAAITSTTNLSNSSGSYLVDSTMATRCTATAAVHNRGISCSLAHGVDAGQTNSGSQTGAWFEAFRNYSIGTNDGGGTLATLTGFKLSAGHFNTAAVAPTTTTADVVLVNAYYMTGTIGTLTGLNLNMAAGAGGTVTTKCGLNIGNVAGATTNQAIVTGSGLVIFGDSTVSSSSSTGALVVTGGVGIGGALNVAGALASAAATHSGVTSITDTTDATTATAASLKTLGGLGVTKNIIGKQGLGFGVTSVTTAAGTTTMSTTSTAIQVFTGSTTQTLTLPAANAFGAGIAVTVWVKNVSTGLVTVQRAGADTINSTASNVTSFTLAQWASCMLVSDGVSAWERF